jgi:hypothetical protein
MSSQTQDTTLLHRTDGAPLSPLSTVVIPPDHVGEFVIAGTGRRVWWTGRVAIGLLYQPERRCEPVAQSALWVQELMLRKPRRSGVIHF